MKIGNNIKNDALKTLRLNIKKSYKIYVSTVQQIKPSELFIILLHEIKILSQMGFCINSIREIILKATEYEFKYDTLYVLFKKLILKKKEISLPQLQQQIMIETKLKCLIN